MKIAEKIKLQFKFLKLGLNLVYLKPWFKLEMKIWAYGFLLSIIHVILMKFLNYKTSNVSFAALKISKWSLSNLMAISWCDLIQWDPCEVNMCTDWYHHVLIDIVYHMDVMERNRCELIFLTAWVGLPFVKTGLFRQVTLLFKTVNLSISV